MISLLLPLLATAELLNLPRWIPQHSFSLGLEPTVIFASHLAPTSGVGTAIKLQWVHGYTDLSNVMLNIGTGNGPYGWQLGGGMTFDFFADNQNGPGAGLALTARFLRLPSGLSFEPALVPYVHKTLKTNSIPIEPYLAVPTNLSLSNGRYSTLVTLVLGSYFHHTQTLVTSCELGVSLSNATTYFSGGLTYYH